MSHRPFTYRKTVSGYNVYLFGLPLGNVRYDKQARHWVPVYATVNGGETLPAEPTKADAAESLRRRELSR